MKKTPQSLPDDVALLKKMLLEQTQKLERKLAQKDAALKSVVSGLQNLANSNPTPAQQQQLAALQETLQQ